MQKPKNVRVLARARGETFIIDMLKDVIKRLENGAPVTKAVLITAHTDKADMTFVTVDTAGAVRTAIDVAGLISLGEKQALAGGPNG